MISTFQRIFAFAVVLISVSFGIQLARGMELSKAQMDSSASADSEDTSDDHDNLLKEIKEAYKATSDTQPSSETNPTPTLPANDPPSVVETVKPQQSSQKEPRALIRTSIGDITIKLFSSQTPISVTNFIGLANGEKEFTDVKTSKKVTRPFYDGMIFHKVVPGKFIQTGCPFGTGRGGPGFSIPDEIRTNLNFTKPGLVAMAPQQEGGKTRKDSNGSQFFITLAPMPSWDQAYTIIGEVEKGMDIVRKIGAVDVGPTDRPIRHVHIDYIEVLP